MRAAGGLSKENLNRERNLNNRELSQRVAPALILVALPERVNERRIARVTTHVLGHLERR